MKFNFLVILLFWTQVFAQDISPEQFQEIKKKAEQGDSNAQFDLGICYSTGNGVSQNKDEAIKWFDKAAKNIAAKENSNQGIRYEFTTNVSWQSFDTTGPKKPINKTVNWRVMDGGFLMVQEVESKEWVKCDYQAQRKIDGDVVLMHTGKLTDGRQFSISIILRKEKIYYSLATTRGDVEHITYGLCHEVLKQYFAAKIKY